MQMAKVNGDREARNPGEPNNQGLDFLKIENGLKKNSYHNRIKKRGRQAMTARGEEGGII